MARGDDKILAEAKARRAHGEEYQSNARMNWLEDVRFANADDINGWQWDNGVRETRADRPCLTVNKVRQHVLQIVNDARQNKAGIKITPTGGGATYEAAQVFEGLCRHIEYRSQATAAYDKATWDQVQGGIGYWRLTTRYVDDTSMDQELHIQRVPDAMAIILDPDIQQYDASDARWGMVDSKMPTEDAERDYPEIKGLANTKTMGFDDCWHGSDYVRVVEYYRIKDQSDRLHVLPDGTTMKESEAKDQGDRLAAFTLGLLDDDGEPLAGKAALRAVSTQDRAITSPVVEWFKIVGERIVDRKDTVFDSIPIVRVVGEETVIDGRLDWKGHVRALRDPQRMYNYWNSAAVEFVALQSKTPFIGTPEAIQGHEEAWDTANTVNHSILLHNGYDDAGRPVARPERAAPPVMAQAFIQGMQIADQQMMMASGQYQAELGRPGNETSGVAIQQRQRQGDTATYHYIDHLAQAIRYTGRLIVRAAPKVYDTPRLLKIMGRDSTLTDVHVDPELPDAHQVQPDPQPPEPTPQGTAPSPQDQAAENVKTIFNPNVGTYEVEADVGPSFGTQRQEAFNAFTQIMSQNPQAGAMFMDIMLKNADFPGADEAAERAQRMLPPQATGGPPPEVQALHQQLQAVQAHGQGIAQQADQEVSSLKQQLADMKRQLAEKSAQMENARYDSETRRIAAVGGIDPAAMLPIIRQMVSEVLGTPALPVMQQHAEEDAMHGAAMSAANQAMMPEQPGIQ